MDLKRRSVFEIYARVFLIDIEQSLKLPYDTDNASGMSCTD